MISTWKLSNGASLLLSGFDEQRDIEIIEGIKADIVRLLKFGATEMDAATIAISIADQYDVLPGPIVMESAMMSFIRKEAKG